MGTGKRLRRPLGQWSQRAVTILDEPFNDPGRSPGLLRRKRPDCTITLLIAYPYFSDHARIFGKLIARQGTQFFWRAAAHCEP